MTGPSLKSEAGTTLIEVLVAIAIFVIVVSTATSIFLVSSSAARKVVYDQNLQGSATYTLESMSREMRMGQIDNSYLAALGQKAGCMHQGISMCVYKTDTLEFTSSGGSNIKYSLNSQGQIQRQEGSAGAVPVSSLDVDVQALQFWISAGQNINPRISVFLEAKPRSNSRFTKESNIQVQTTITTRQYGN